MKKVWKYPLTENSQEVELPIGAEILSVKKMKCGICLWALVNPDAPTEVRKICVIGTGRPLPNWVSKKEYLDSFQLEDNRVIHLFGVGK